MFTIAENNSITVLLYDPSQVQSPNMTNEVSVLSNLVRFVCIDFWRNLNKVTCLQLLNQNTCI